MLQTHDEADRGSSYSTPRWVKVFGIIALVLALLIATVLITGLGGEHGPGRHTPSTEQAVESNNPSIHTLPDEDSTQQP